MLRHIHVFISYYFLSIYFNSEISFFASLQTDKTQVTIKYRCLSFFAKNYKKTFEAIQLIIARIIGSKQMLKHVSVIAAN